MRTHIEWKVAILSLIHICQGKKVALIEKSKSMYGGTCINIACIPTKTLIVAAEKGLDFEQAMKEKNAVTTRLNGKNYATIAGTGVDLSLIHIS